MLLRSVVLALKKNYGGRKSERLKEEDEDQSQETENNNQ